LHSRHRSTSGIDPLKSPDSPSPHDTGSNLGLFESGTETRSCVDHVTVDHMTVDHVTMDHVTMDHVTMDHMTACAYMDSVTMHDDVIIAQFAC